MNTIYFAITQALIDKQGIPETIESGVFSWNLNHNTFYACVVADSAGKVLDYVKPYAKVPYAICKASVSDSDIANAFACALNGDTFNFQVKVIELTWIK